MSVYTAGINNKYSTQLWVAAKSNAHAHITPFRYKLPNVVVVVVAFVVVAVAAAVLSSESKIMKHYIINIIFEIDMKYCVVVY